jgi:hypothetical protein
MIPAAEGQEQHAAPSMTRDGMAEEELEDDLTETFDELEVDEPEIDEDLDEELDEDVLGEDDDLVDPVAEDEEEEEEAVPVAKKRRAGEEEDEDEDLVDPDDVEADLDTILKDRIAAGDDEADEDEEETAEVDTSPESGDRVLPRRADEFVCESCFLVKNLGQRVGPGNLCRDCV